MSPDKSLALKKEESFPFNECYKHFEDNDYNQAKEYLGLTTSDFSNDEVLGAFLNLKNAFVNVSGSNFDDAQTQLQKSIIIFEKTTNIAIWEFIEFLTNLVMGINRLTKGDPHGALSHLDKITPVLNEASLYGDDMKNTIEMFQGISYLILANIEYNSGNEIKSNQYQEKYKLLAEKLIEKFDVNKSSELELKLVVHNTKMQLYNTKLFRNIIFFDIERSKLIYSESKKDYDELKKYESNLPTSAFATIISSALNFYDLLGYALNLISNYSTHKKFGKEDFENFIKFKSLKFKTEKQFLAIGEIGKVHILLLSQLTSFVNNFFKMGKLSKKDFSLTSSIIFFVVFCLLQLLTKYLINPTDTLFAVYFLGNLIVSLIVGFGYGALRYIPLIRLYSNALKSKEE